MRVTEALELEIKAIETKDKEIIAYQRDDVIQLIIGFRFKDGHTHWLLPDKNSTEKMSLELSNISRESDRWKTIEVAVTMETNVAHSSVRSFMNFLRRKTKSW
jgi:hypothetical protein